MKYKLLIFTFLLGFSIQTHAVVCWNSKGQGVVDEVFYDLSNAFTSTNNTTGSVVQLTKNFDTAVYGICPVHSSADSRTRRSYVTNLPIVEQIAGYKYLKINDYLIGAMQITDSAVGVFYPPENYVYMGRHANVNVGKAFPVKDSNFVFRLKVTKPFIDFVPIPKKTMFTVYVTTEVGEPLSMPIYTISYSGSVTVPQSCDIGVGDVLEIDFGKISANAFAQAGAGNKPIGTNVQARTLSIQCKNINAQAALTLRLQAEQVNNDMMQSDNPDIGFKLSDQSGNVLIPNNMSSTIPFHLENPSNVTIKAWPVSTTGNVPQTGPFKARGYLRVDFE